MAVKIRLKRIGRKKQPSYRIVVSESRNSRGGKVIDSIGYYSPYLDDKPLEIQLDKVDEWASKGAVATDAAKRLIRRARRIADGVIPKEPKPKPAQVKPAAEVEATPSEPAAEVAVEETAPEEAVEEPAEEPAEEPVSDES